MAGRLPPYRPGMKMVHLSGKALQWIGFVLACLSSFSIAVLQRGILKLDSEGAMEAVSEAMKPGGDAMGWATGAVFCSLAATLMVPIFAKAAYEGWKHAASSGKFLLHVFACALVSEIPYDFAMNGKPLDTSVQNPVWGLLLAAVMLEILKRWKMRTKPADIVFRAVIVLAAVVWAVLLRVYIGPVLVLLAALFHFAAKKPAAAIAGGAVLTLLQFPAPIGMLFVHWYDGEKEGDAGKWMGFLYPAQLIIFGLLSMMIK